MAKKKVPNQKVAEFKQICLDYTINNDELVNDKQFMFDLKKATTFQEISGAFMDWDIDEFHLDECIGLYFAK